MKKLLYDFKLSFGSATGLYYLIMLNVAVFLLIQLVRLVLFLAGIDSEIFMDYAYHLSLPASFGNLITNPWSVITYMFLHFNFMHIFFNMLILYWTGLLFSEYLGNDKLWATYILGGLAGALCYLIMYNVLPVFNESIGSARLLGASAGVIAVLFAVATLLPNYTVQLLIFGPVRLKYIALFSILLYAISIPDGNAGGNFAHLGGAFFGFFMIRQLQKGNDWTAWLIRLVIRFRKPNMRAVASRKTRGETEIEYADRKKSRQEIIDKILDKISQSGYESLSAEEKDILFKASKNMKE